jgi:formate-dependent nitrite reductase membrane component NrfD
VSESEVTRSGIRNASPGRHARIAEAGDRRGHHRRHGRGEQPTVPDAEFGSYYGRPVLKPPVWNTLDIGGYLFCGGLAGTSSVLGAVADLTGRPAVRRASRVGSVAALALGAAGLVHDLGKPGRAMNMLRVVKPSSPMNTGSWLLSAYAPMAGAAAASELLPARWRGSGAGRLLATAGRPGGLAAAVLGSLVATYTAVLVADTAVPAWHDGYRQLPYLFAASASSSAAGLALVAAPPAETGPARRLAVAAAGANLAATELLARGVGGAAVAYRRGRAGRLRRAATALTVTGTAVGATVGGRNRLAAAGAGLALLAGGLLERFAILEAGRSSAEDPAQTVEPQRRRLAERAR